MALQTKQITPADVESTINGNDIVIFSKTYCPYCVTAKQAVSNYSGTVVELDTLSKENEMGIKEKIVKLSGINTVPVVFVKGKFFGDGSATRDRVNKGDLKNILG